MCLLSSLQNLSSCSQSQMEGNTSHWLLIDFSHFMKLVLMNLPKKKSLFKTRIFFAFSFKYIFCYNGATKQRRRKRLCCVLFLSHFLGWYLDLIFLTCLGLNWKDLTRMSSGRAPKRDDTSDCVPGNWLSKAAITEAGADLAMFF